MPGFDEVVSRIVNQSWERGDDAMDRAIGRAVQQLIVLRLMDLAGNENASFDVRSIATSALRRLAAPEESGRIEAIERHHRALLSSNIQRFLDRPWSEQDAGRPLPAPPGSPIGDDGAIIEPYN